MYRSMHIYTYIWNILFEWVKKLSNSINKVWVFEGVEAFETSEKLLKDFLLRVVTVSKFSIYIQLRKFFSWWYVTLRLLNISWNIRTSHLLPPTKLRRGFINLLTWKICTFYVTWFLHIYIFVVLLMPHEDTNLLSYASFVSYVFVEMFVNWGNKKVFCFAWIVLHTCAAHANVSIKYT